MTTGIVTLDGKPYMIDIRRYVDSLANQMAPKISEGDQRYGSLDSWSAWIQTDWQMGLGHVRPTGEDTGYLFGEADTRVPKQIILPPQLQQCDGRVMTDAAEDCRYMPSTVTSTWTITTGGAIQAVAIRIRTPATVPDLLNAFFYGYLPYGDELRISLYDYDGGYPDSQVFTSTMVGNIRTRSHYWWGVTLSEEASLTLTGATNYWLVLEMVSGSFEVAYSSNAGTSATYDGASWTLQTGLRAWHTTSIHGLGLSAFAAGGDSATGSRFIRFNSETYYMRGAVLYKYDSSDDNWDTLSPGGSISGNVSSLEVYGPYLYIATSVGTWRMNTSESASSLSPVTAQLFKQYKGLLYRADGANLYYTDDGSNWIGPFAMGGSDVSIRGMAGMNGDMYCATDKSLMRLAPGDIVDEIFRFGAEDSANGLNMIEKDNTLYIPANGRVFRFGPDGVLLDIWVGRNADLSQERLGRIDALARMNQWLIALVNAQQTTLNRPMLLAYQTEGWHPLAVLPNENNPLDSITDLDTFYDRENSRLWISCRAIGPMFLDIPDYALNPYNLDTYRFENYAWIEWDWFDGPVRELQKDYESVQLVGENFSSSTYAKVYWQDDDSTDWEYLGQYTSDNEEIRWEYPYTTRPNTKRIKLGIQLFSNSQNETPRIDAVRLKFHMMIRDWFRFSLPIQISGVAGTPQQLSDGAVQAYTGQQQLDNLRVLVRQVKPFLYADPIGDQWEVKVNEGVWQLSDWERLPSGTARWDGIYTITLEQITSGEYSA